VNKKSLT